jgi:hypothetical protein
MDSANPNIRALVNRFFAKGAHPRVKDQVFTLKRKLLEVKIEREDDENIYWADNGHLSKKEIAAIIYTDGRSKILCSTNEAAQVLGACQGTPLNLGVGTDMEVSSKAAAPGGVAGPTGGSGASTAAAGGSKGGAGVPPVGAGVSTVGKISTNAGFDQDSATRARVAALLGGVTRKEFEQKAEQKTAQFTDYLKVLCDKTAGYEELDKAVAQALTLFVNEDAMVEVSSNNRNSVLRLRIRDYLRKVKQIQYDKIEVKWTHVQYVSDLKPGPDGNLYGTVSFEQEFRGYRDGKLVYSDVTLKHANVVLKTYNKTYEGSTRKIWDVLLSDIGVVATKTL